MLRVQANATYTRRIFERRGLSQRRPRSWPHDCFIATSPRNVSLTEIENVPRSVLYFSVTAS